MARVNDTPRTILVAEDSSDDLFFARRAIREVCGKEVIVVNDGQECIDYLSKCSLDPGSNPRPDLVILDIKMPRADGHEVLSWLRSQPALNDIPAIVISGSVQEADRLRCLSAGAIAYFTKPADIDQILDLVRQCGQKWKQWRRAENDGE